MTDMIIDELDDEFDEDFDEVSLSDEEQLLKDSLDSVRAAQQKEAYDRGYAVGLAKVKEKAARKMLKAGADIESVCQQTGLTEDIVAEIKSQL